MIICRQASLTGDRDPTLDYAVRRIFLNKDRDSALGSPPTSANETQAGIKTLSLKSLIFMFSLSLERHRQTGVLIMAN